MRGATDGLIHLLLLAITTQPPQADRIAWRFPRLPACGLADLKRCWIVVEEYDYHIAERSWYIEPDGNTIGWFSKTFMMKIATTLLGARQSGRSVSRLD